MARLGRGQPNRPIVARTAVPSGGTGSIDVAFTLTGTGTKHASGTGTIHIAFTATGTGTKATAGSGTIAVAFTLSGSGTKSTGIGVPPRPRVRWQFILGSAAGGHELALTEAKSRRYTAKLTEPSELTFDIDGRHAQASSIEQLTTDVHLLWTDSGGSTRILDRCRVGQLRDSITAEAHRLTVDTMDYREVLNRRILFNGDQVTYAGVDQAEIAWGLISSSQGHYSGHLGIVKGWSGTTPTGQLRDRTYEVGDTVGQRIQELSEVIDGFDWDIQPENTSTLRLDVFSPQRGASRGVVLECGGLVAAADRTESSADYVNALRYTGGGDPAPTPVEYQAAELDPAEGGLVQGRWDRAYGDDGLTTEMALVDRAIWQLDTAQVITPVWTVRLRRGAWDGPDHIWLGDTVQLVVMSGRLRTNGSYRVFEVQIDINDAGAEDVTLALGGPRPDYRRRVTAIERRLNDLERR